MLESIEKSDWGKGAVKRFNVQYYFDGPEGSSLPKAYVEKIKSKLPDFDTDAFLSIGCWARSKDQYGEWSHSCPPDVADTIAYFNQDALGSVCGGFIWNLDCIMQTSLDPSACVDKNGDKHYAFQGDYRNAIFDGLVKKWTP